MDGENTSKKSVFVFWGFSGTFWKEIFHRGSFIIISKEEHGSVQYANDVLPSRPLHLVLCGHKANGSTLVNDTHTGRKPDIVDVYNPLLDVVCCQLLYCIIFKVDKILSFKKTVFLSSFY